MNWHGNGRHTYELGGLDERVHIVGSGWMVNVISVSLKCARLGYGHRNGGVVITSNAQHPRLTYLVRLRRECTTRTGVEL
ncbi:MAG: hypothetical protein ACXQS4_02090 [Methermicoccaceae archaeon]